MKFSALCLLKMTTSHFGGNMKLRNQIEEKYKWDLEMFKTDEEIEKVFSYIEKLTKILPTYNGKLGEKDKLYEYFFKYKKEENAIEKLQYYIFNTYSVDNSNTEILKLNTRFQNAMSKYTRATAFAYPQICKLSDKYLKDVIKDKRFKNLDNYFKDIIKFKPHSLDEKTSDVIAKLNKSFNQNSDIFDIITDSELTFEDALDSKGKKHKIDNASYVECVSGEDRTLRKNAYFSMYNGYKKFNKTFATLLLGDFDANLDYLKLRKYNNQLELCLLANDVPKGVFDKNIDAINKNLCVLQNFVKTSAKKSGLKNYAIYDLYEDKKIGGKISVEKAQEIVLNALAPLGGEYIAKVKQKLNDKSIDYMPNQNKASGGYSTHVYDAKPVILMNWTYDYDSVSTLAHEMGHCINSVYFLSAQPEEKADVIIPLAEIASTVNETLLSVYMINNCKKKDKDYYLFQLLDRFNSTVFTQTLYTEWELFVHTCIENETPITYEDLNKKYYELLKKYYGNSLIIPDCAKYHWSRVPHFYRPYYVYSYSTGMITAIAIVSKLLKDKNYSKKYIEFLKNGTNKSFIEILKSIDIDLTTDEPYEIAFNFIKEKLNEYKNC